NGGKESKRGVERSGGNGTADDRGQPQPGKIKGVFAWSLKLRPSTPSAGPASPYGRGYRCRPRSPPPAAPGPPPAASSPAPARRAAAPCRPAGAAPAETAQSPDWAAIRSAPDKNRRMP